MGNKYLMKNNQTNIIGRDYSFSVINSLYNDVINGSTKTLIIKGEAGIGKTYLVENTINAFDQATIIKAKQLKYNDKTFTLIKDIIESILDHVLVLQAVDYQSVIATMRKEIGNNIGYLCNFSENAVHIFKDIKAKPITDYSKTKYQIRRAIKTFIKCAGDVLFPLVIFIDDLQWVDGSSLDILSVLIKDDTLNCFIIATTRDDCDEKLKLEKHIESICLNPFKEAEIRRMLSNRIDQNIPDMRYLPRFVYSLTLGNPFYISSIIETLLDEKIIEYKEKWHVHIDRLNYISVPENIADIMMSRLLLISNEERMFLHYLSIFDGKTSCSNLNLLLELDKETILKITNDLVSKSFIISSENGDEIFYQFAHDIIFEHIYNQIDIERRKNIHYQIANKCDDQNIFISHFIRSDLKMWDNKELEKYVLLLIQEAEKTLGISDYHKCIEIYKLCIEIMKTTLDISKKDVEYKMLLNLARCYYLCNDKLNATEIFDNLASRYKENEQLIEIKRNYMDMLAFSGEHETVIEVGKEALSLLRCTYDLNLLQNDIAEINLLYTDELIKKLTKNPYRSNNKESLDILYQMMPSAQIVSAKEFVYVLGRLAVVSAKDNSYSLEGLLATSFVFYNIIGDQNKGKAISDYIFKVLPDIDDDILKIRLTGFMLSFVYHWSNSLDDVVSLLDESIQSSYESGDVVYLEYMIAALMFALLVMGKNLNDIIDKIYEKMELIKDLEIENPQFASHYIVENLNRFTSHMIAGDIGEGLNNKFANNSITLVNMWFELQKSYHAGDMGTAFVFVDNVKNYFKNAKGHIIYIELVFYSLIIRLEQHISLPDDKKAENKQLIDTYLAILEETCSHFEINHKARLLIAKGLYNCIFGDGIKTIGLYNKSLLVSKDTGNILLEAIANTLASKYYIKQPELSDFYKRQAGICYQNWGACHIANMLNVNNSNSLLLNNENQKLELDKLVKLGEREAFTYVLNEIVDSYSGIYTAIIFEKANEMMITYEKRSNGNVILYDKPINITGRPNISRKAIMYSFRTSKTITTGDNLSDILFETKYSVICIPLKLLNIVVGVFYLEFSDNKTEIEDIVSKINTLIPSLLTKCSMIKDIDLKPKNAKLLDTNPLTERESVIIKHVADGLSNQDISRIEFISVGTVKSHLSNIYSKLDTDNRVKAVAKAKEMDFIN